MTWRTILPVLAAALAVGACEQKPPVVIDPELAELGAEAEKYVRSFPGWINFTESVIVYGESIQDDGGPSVGCMMEEGKGTIEVAMGTDRRPEGPPIPPREDEIHDGRWNGELTLASGGVSATVPARITLMGRLGYSVRTEPALPSDHPVLAAFARTGEITVSSRGETRKARPAPLPLVEAMMEACAPEPAGAAR